MIWELMAFEEVCLQKVTGQEPKPSLKELSHFLQMKGRPANKTGDKARQERRRTRGKL